MSFLQLWGLCSLGVIFSVIIVAFISILQWSEISIILLMLLISLIIASGIYWWPL